MNFEDIEKINYLKRDYEAINKRLKDLGSFREDVLLKNKDPFFSIYYEKNNLTFSDVQATQDYKLVQTINGSMNLYTPKMELYKDVNLEYKIGAATAIEMIDILIRKKKILMRRLIKKLKKLGVEI